MEILPEYDCANWSLYWLSITTIININMKLIIIKMAVFLKGEKTPTHMSRRLQTASLMHTKVSIASFYIDYETPLCVKN